MFRRKALRNYCLGFGCFVVLEAALMSRKKIYFYFHHFTKIFISRLCVPI